jgi:signal transduction histidine kinase
MSLRITDILHYVDLPPADAPPPAFDTRERAILAAINEKVGAQASLESIVDFLASATRDISPCDRVSLAFVEEDGRRVRAHYARALYEPVLLTRGYQQDLSGSSLEHVLARGTPRIIDDLQQYLALQPDSASTRLLVREGVRSSMTCPLRVEGRAVGLLFRSARRPRAYDAHQAALHLAVAERLGQTVEKTYRIEQLSEANRAYFELLGFASHELKSPLASIITEANLLLDGFVGELSKPQRDCLKRMVRRSHHLLGLVGDYLGLARLEGGGMKLQTAPDVDFVSGVLNPAVEVVTPQIESRDVALECNVPAEMPRVELDPELLKVAVVNLLDNAVKYGREHGRVRINVAHDGARLTVIVWNEGAGWPTGQQERLFRRFSRLQTPELLKEKGTGLGLYTAWRIVLAHGGRIAAASEHQHWAEFRIEIPQPLPHAAETPP